MNSGIKVLLLLSGCLDNIIVVFTDHILPLEDIPRSALKCWKCIAHDCNSNLEENYKASKVKCHEGQRCMLLCSYVLIIIALMVIHNLCFVWLGCVAVTCGDQKVRYRMFDNVTHYDSVIRTCTDNKCDKSSLDSFYSCVATPTKYMIGGCTLRLCCDDRDLCNFSDTNVSVSFTSVIVAGVIAVLGFDR